MSPQLKRRSVHLNYPPNYLYLFDILTPSSKMIKEQLKMQWQILKLFLIAISIILNMFKICQQTIVLILSYTRMMNFICKKRLNVFILNNFNNLFYSINQATNHQVVLIKMDVLTFSMCECFFALNF